jgi:hypothetical protein
VFNGVMDLDAAGPSLSVPAALRKKKKNKDYNKNHQHGIKT